MDRLVARVLVCISLIVIETWIASYGMPAPNAWYLTPYVFTYLGVVLTTALVVLQHGDPPKNGG